MAITVSGLGSGMDYDTWIKQLVAVKQSEIDQVSKNITGIKKQETALDSVESAYKSFLESMQKFTKTLSGNDVFNQKTVTSSTNAVTAEVTAKSDIQDLQVTVSQLATSTVAGSQYSAASFITGDTKLTEVANGALKTGTLSFYVDGQKTQITIPATTDGEATTLSDIVDLVNGNTEKGISDQVVGVTASIVNGKLSFTADSLDPEGQPHAYSISVGSTTDTSNFSSVMSLTRDSVTGNYSSSKTIFDTNTKGAITDTTFRTSGGADVAVSAGTFYINGQSFTITAGSTSMESIVKAINSNSEAGVTASWDVNSGKFNLTATDQGAINIDIKAGTSNFTDVMGLTSSQWEVPGEEATSSVILTSAQELGTNAILTINGTTITSASNTVTSDVSGIAGLTLTLKDETEKTETVSIKQNTDKVTEAITELVNAYNSVIAKSDAATTTDGVLYGETILNSIRNKVRTLMTSAVSGDAGYNTLASIGISTGKVGNTDAATGQLTIDKDALAAALNDNPDAVKKLLIGEGATLGVLDKIETVVTNATNSVNGYFVTREKSYDKQIGRLNDKVSDMEDNLERYQKQLEAKFAAMDSMIAALEKQASVFDSYFNKKSDDDK